MSSQPLHPTMGLCEHCGHAVRITTAKGSAFILCNLSKTDARFAKYPRLPVLACSGFERPPTGDSSNESVP